MRSISIVLVVLQFLATYGYRLSSRSRPLQPLAMQQRSSLTPTEGRGLRAILAAALLAGWSILGASDVMAVDRQYKLPPIDRRDPDRCVLLSSSMGQANAARDKLYDLRECDLHGKDGSGKDLSGKL